MKTGAKRVLNRLWFFGACLLASLTPALMVWAISRNGFAGLGVSFSLAALIFCLRGWLQARHQPAGKAALIYESALGISTFIFFLWMTWTVFRLDLSPRDIQLIPLFALAVSVPITIIFCLLMLPSALWLQEINDKLDAKENLSHA